MYNVFIIEGPPNYNNNVRSNQSQSLTQNADEVRDLQEVILLDSIF